LFIFDLSFFPSLPFQSLLLLLHSQSQRMSNCCFVAVQPERI
jgi:hypothetical protein